MKKVLIVTLAVVGLISVGAIGFVSTKDEPVIEASTTEEVAMKKSETDKITPETDTMVKDDEAMVKEDAAPQAVDTETAMQKAPSYTTLADFNSNTNLYKDNKKVYFFHAPWCPICRGIDEDISSDNGQIPSGTTFIKTDFDSNTALRQKYGVTVQYTFVQVDSDGNKVKQWSATTLDKAVAGIQ